MGHDNNNDSNQNNIDPEIWGNDAWNYFHYVIFAYPVNPSNSDKYNYMNWCRMFAATLPCETCKNSFKLLIERPPLMLTQNILESRNSFIKWGWMVHNEVNKKTNSDNFISYEAFLNKHKNIHKSSGSDKSKSSDKSNQHFNSRIYRHINSSNQHSSSQHDKPYKCATCGKK